MIPYNRPHEAARAVEYVREVLASRHRHGDGPFTARCQSWLEAELGCPRAVLTTSCTTALEMAAILADLSPGDEVVMPSFTFTSSANAFVLRGAVPVFVDIEPGTQNIDPARLEAAITPRTRAVVPVHYAGISCDMDAICKIARRHDLIIIEDAAQAIQSRQDGAPVGTRGHLGAISFHDSKNVSAGEAGALIINDPRFVERAEIIREKGTNRSRFVRGEVDKYTWVDLGSSFLPSEITAAVLLAQLEEAEATTRARRAIWERYSLAFERIGDGRIGLPWLPRGAEPNGHIFYLIFGGLQERDRFIAGTRQKEVTTLFHYVPLHSSPAGQRFGRTHGSMEATLRAGQGLVRLPLWRGMTPEMVDHVIEASCASFSEG